MRNIVSSKTSYLASLSVYVVAFCLLGACATSSKDWTTVSQKELQDAVTAIQAKIDGGQVHRFKETGDLTIDVLVKPFIDAGTETGPKSLALAQELQETPALTLLTRSTEAAMDNDPGLSIKDATEQVINGMEPGDRIAIKLVIDKKSAALKQQEQNSVDWLKKSIPLLVDLGLKAKAISDGGMLAAYEGASVALAINNGIDQINALIDCVAPANELIRRTSQKLSFAAAASKFNLQDR
jgi:hypothetical protein